MSVAEAVAAPAAAPAESPAGPIVRVMRRGADGAIAMNLPASEIGEAIADPGNTVWVDIEGPEKDLPAIEAMFRDVFEFHPLAIEDALQESHLPKLDDWCGYLYLVFHGLTYDAETDHVRLNELDIFLGKNYLVTCHSALVKPVENVRRQVERDPERASHGPDHLLYHILDLGTDEYLEVIEKLDESIDAAQEQVFNNPTPATLQKIFRVKRSAVKLHRVLAPQREVVNRLARDAYPQIDAPDRVYFRDVYDHIVRLHDISETLRDLVSGALDTYLSVVSNRTNDIMKALTIWTVMFLPLNFLVGFFGMNFFGENIELPMGISRTSLFWAGAALMIGMPIGIFIWARRKGWF